MKQLFLAPRSSETAYKNYISSMQGKSLDEFAAFLDPAETEQLKGDDKYFVWGCQPSLKGRWDAMEHGDYVLFYSHGQFISVGKLKFKKFSEDLALGLWPKSKESGEPWSCVFFVEDIHEINLSLNEFNEITGYSLRQVQGFMRVGSTDALSRINKAYGSTEGFIRSLVMGMHNDEVAEIISISNKPAADVTVEDKSKLDDLTRSRTDEEIQFAIELYAKKQLNKTPEQIQRITKSYKRNAGLVRAMKEKFKNKCQICGFTFKTKSGTYYSEAAHIIPISDGRPGVDSPDNMWILCANHHKMLDRGAIVATGTNTYTLNGQSIVLTHY